MSKTTDKGLKRAEKRRSNRLKLSDFWRLSPFSAIFQLNHGNHLRCVRSWSTLREPPAMGKQLVSFSICDCESSAAFS